MQVDYLYQEKAFLEDRLQRLEFELRMFPDIPDKESDPGYQGLTKEIVDLKAEIADTSKQIGDRLKKMPQRSEEEQLRQRFPDLQMPPQEEPQQTNFDHDMILRLQEQLQSEARRIQQRIDQLRPDQQSLGRILRGQLADIVQQLDSLDEELNQIDDSTEPPFAFGEPSMLPGMMPPGSLPPQSIPGTQRAATVRDINRRLQMLQIAYENLTAAGYPELAGLVRGEIDLLTSPQQFTQPEEIPGSNDMRPLMPQNGSPNDFDPSMLMPPVDEPSMPAPPSFSSPPIRSTVEPTPQTQESPSPTPATPSAAPTSAPTSTTALPAKDEALQQEVTQLRGQVETLTGQLQQILDRMPQEPQPAP